jgi:hypothetical protein
VQRFCKPKVGSSILSAGTGAAQRHALRLCIEIFTELLVKMAEFRRSGMDIHEICHIWKWPKGCCAAPHGARLSRSMARILLISWLPERRLRRPLEQVS